MHTAAASGSMHPGVLAVQAASQCLPPWNCGGCWLQRSSGCCRGLPWAADMACSSRERRSDSARQEPAHNAQHTAATCVWRKVEARGEGQHAGGYLQVCRRGQHPAGGHPSQVSLLTPTGPPTAAATAQGAGPALPTGGCKGGVQPQTGGVEHSGAVGAAEQQLLPSGLDLQAGERNS